MKTFKLFVTDDNQLYTQKSGDILRESTVTEAMEVVADLLADVWVAEDIKKAETLKV